MTGLFGTSRASDFTRPLLLTAKQLSILNHISCSTNNVFASMTLWSFGLYS